VRIYLDHNATTPLHEGVIAAMERSLREGFGNPSSAHAEGARAKRDLDRAREQVASLLGCAPREVVFTACATEAINTALIGSLAGREGAPGHVVSSNVEHPAAEASLAALETRGWRVTRLPVDADGLLTPGDVEAALQPDTAMVSLIWANNETGVLLPLEEIAQRVKARGVPLHVDATQRVGKLPVDVAAAGIELLSLSAHKLNGPKGAGALIVRGEQAFEPLLRGGGQERGRRGGTENLSGVVGLGAACALAEAELPERAERLGGLRDRLWQGIEAKIPDVRRNGPAACVLPNTLNVEFSGAAGEVLLQALDLEGISVSMGAACSSGSIEPSRVLVAMGRGAAEARGSLRFSTGLGNDEAQIDRALAVLPDLVARARQAVDA
jgi:cysteine desulfurase